MNVPDNDLTVYVSEIQDSHEKDSLIIILNVKVNELRDSLEDINCSLAQTAANRGGILALRELLDLFE